jgi:sugar-phosphatase
VIFDLDGVLVDSLACVDFHWRSWAAAHGIDESTALRAAHGRRSTEIIRMLAPQLDVPRETAESDAWEAAHTEGVAAMEGAAELLRSLPADRWAVATSGSRATATARLRHTGLPVPQVLVTSEDVRHGKPDPEVFLLAARRLGVDPAACLVVEDAPAGVQAARAAGMRVIGLTAAAENGPAGADAFASRLGEIHISSADRRGGTALVVRVGPPA